MSEHDPKPFADWIGRTSGADDLVAPRLLQSFRAILSPHLADTAPDVAPPGLHWCLCPPIAPMDALGADGHPALSRDLPPVPAARRMWAGGSVESLDALRAGDRVHRVSTIADIAFKRGRSGNLWFVAVDHDYVTGRGPAVRERHDIVYREAAATGTRPGVTAPDAGAPPPLPPARLEWAVETSPVLLFRYSAATFNGHRIHYDMPYATGVEGYEGLVVHGPLMATLLFNLATTAGGAVPRRFTYRGLMPAIAGGALSIRVEDAPDGPVYRVRGASGKIHMEARAELA